MKNAIQDSTGKGNTENIRYEFEDLLAKKRLHVKAAEDTIKKAKVVVTRHRLKNATKK